jgi:hypothetical protein
VPGGQELTGSPTYEDDRACPSPKLLVLVPGIPNVDNESDREACARRESFPVSHRLFRQLLVDGSCSPDQSTDGDKTGNVCFVIDRGRSGLCVDLASVCDHFVHVPHARIDAGPAADVGQTNQPADSTSRSVCLLDVPSCLSIVLHHYTMSAQFRERRFHETKFDVERPDWRAFGDRPG